MPLSSSNAFRQISEGKSQGTVFGQSTSDIIGFYGGASSGTLVGATTLVGANVATSITAAVNATSGGAGTTWSFGSSTQANAVIGLLAWAINAGIVRCGRPCHFHPRMQFAS